MTPKIRLKRRMVALDEALLDRVDGEIQKEKGMWSSTTDFIRDAIRDKIEERVNMRFPGKTPA